MIQVQKTQWTTLLLEDGSLKRVYQFTTVEVPKNNLSTREKLLLRAAELRTRISPGITKGQVKRR